MIEREKDSVVARDAPALQYASPSTDHEPLVFTIGVIGLRLLGVYFILNIVNVASTIIGRYWSPYQRSLRFRSIPEWVGPLIQVLPHLLFTVAGIVLIWQARPIARCLFRDMPTAPSPLTAAAAVRIALIAVGVYLMLDSLPPLAWEMGNIGLGGASEQRYYALFVSSARLLLGAALSLSATRVARLWSRRI